MPRVTPLNFTQPTKPLIDRAGRITCSERGFDWHFNYAFSMYKPAAQRYLNALKAYTKERPELTGRLMYDYLQEAAVAQFSNRDDVSNQHLRSVERMAVESAKVAHADWVKKGNRDTMSAVFTSLADAQLMNVDHDPEVKKIAAEVFELYRQGKVKREPGVVPVKPVLPKIPGMPKAKKPRPGGPLWIERTIEIPYR